MSHWLELYEKIMWMYKQCNLKWLLSYTVNLEVPVRLWHLYILIPVRLWHLYILIPVRLWHLYILIPVRLWHLYILIPVRLRHLYILIPVRLWHLYILIPVRLRHLYILIPVRLRHLYILMLVLISFYKNLQSFIVDVKFRIWNPIPKLLHRSFSLWRTGLHFINETMC
jgi:hypothetical protein